MSLHALHDTAALLHSMPFLTLIVDETTDESNREQVVICLQWVDSSLEARGFYWNLPCSKQNPLLCLLGFRDVIEAHCYALQCMRFYCEQLCSSINEQLIAECFGHVGLCQLCTKAVHNQFAYMGIRDVLLRLNISVTKLCGLCYDGISNGRNQEWSCQFDFAGRA